MTLIVEIHDPSARLSAFIADCMVVDSNDLTFKRNSFPVHLHSGWDIDTLGSYVASKLILGNKRFILGSGSLDRITALSREFLEGSDGIEGFQSILNFHYSEKVKRESFIYGRIEGKEVVSSDSYCERFPAGHLEISCGGSGAEYFRTIFGDLEPKKGTSIGVLAAEALAMLLRLEFVDYTFGKYKFGGAYELVVPDANGLRRVPYTIIDFLAQSEADPKGIFNLSDVQPCRVVACVPFDRGCRFFVFSGFNDRLLATMVEAREVNWGNDLNSGAHTDPKRFLDDYVPDFEICLIRHQNVNWFVTHGLVKFKREKEAVSISLDMMLLNEIMKQISTP